MQKLYIKFSSQLVESLKYQVLSIEINNREYSAQEILSKSNSDKDRILKCPCGANDWTDNGRFINEYECNCCGQFVTVLTKE